MPSDFRHSADFDLFDDGPDPAAPCAGCGHFFFHEPDCPEVEGACSPCAAAASDDLGAIDHLDDPHTCGSA